MHGQLATHGCVPARTTRSCGRRSKSWSRNLAAGTYWWTRSRSSRSTTHRPHEIWSAQQFERWRREAERSNAQTAVPDPRAAHAARGEEITEERFPAAIEIGGVVYALAYKFEPGHPLDGVTMTVPLHLLNQLDERRCEWLVPGIAARQDQSPDQGTAEELAAQPRAGATVRDRRAGNTGAATRAHCCPRCRMRSSARRRGGAGGCLGHSGFAALPAMNFKVVDEEGQSSRWAAICPRCALS